MPAPIIAAVGAAVGKTGCVLCTTKACEAAAAGVAAGTTTYAMFKQTEELDPDEVTYISIE